MDSDLGESASGHAFRGFERCVLMIEVSRGLFAVAFNRVGGLRIKSLKTDVRQLFSVLQRVREDEEESFGAIRKNEFECCMAVVMPGGDAVEFAACDDVTDFTVQREVGFALFDLLRRALVEVDSERWRDW